MSHAIFEDFIADKKISEVECLVADMNGTARGKILPPKKFLSGTQSKGLRVPEEVFTLTINGRFVSDTEAVSDSAIDIYMQPDANTIRLVPWYTEPTAQVICDAYHLNDEPVTISPRHILRKVLQLYKDKGWKPIIAPELEFYLTARNLDPDIQLQPPVGRSGRAETSRQAYSIDAVNEFDPLFEDLYDYCEAQGLDVDTLIHEVGAGQMEINFLHGDPMRLADRVFYFKRTVREAAMRHDMFATFMAKPIAGEPGSAMHVHQSIVNKVTGKNIFSNEDGTASKEFYWYIGGLQKYVPGAMALFAPYVNSYRRLVRANAAPINIQWGTDNRTVGIRSPIATPAARRIENRVIGADANPYVALAATLACGYLGMKNRIEPTPECKGDAYLGAYELPRSLVEALTMLRNETALHEVLGKEFVTVYTEVKEIEHAEFMKVISPWEREHLLLHV